MNELQVYSPDPAACSPNSEDFSGNVYGNGHIKIYEELVAFFAHGKSYPVTYQDTLASIRLLNSFYVANERSQWVDVATAGDSSRLGCVDHKLAELYRTPAPSSD